MTVVQTLFREVLEPREAGEAACLATDGVATGFAPCRANAYLFRMALLPAPAAAKQCEQSLFSVRLNRPLGREVSLQDSWRVNLCKGFILGMPSGDTPDFLGN